MKQRKTNKYLSALLAFPLAITSCVAAADNKFEYKNLRGPDYGRLFVITDDGDESSIFGIYPDASLPLSICDDASPFVCAVNEEVGFIFAFPKEPANVGDQWNHQSYEFTLTSETHLNVAGIDTNIQFVDVSHNGVAGARFGYSRETGLWYYLQRCASQYDEVETATIVCRDQIHIANGVGFGRLDQ